MNEARAAESSDKSSVRIRGSGKVHATELTKPCDSTSEVSDEEEGDIHKVKTGRVLKQTGNRECGSCGGNHNRSTCHFRDAVCRPCEWRVHIAEVCRATQPRNKQGQ
uniref:Uncharacterized protein n=1 Tax=Micrurus carvalhoi TaxID=3147026 RepID=A0A2H6MXF0_9SAUR